MADPGEFDSEESDESAGLPAATKTKPGGVTFRPGQLRMEKHIQRVAAVEKQTERLTEAHGGQRDVMVAHGQQIGRLLSDVDVLSKQMNHYAVRVDEVEKDIEALKTGNPERASYVEARIDATEGVESDRPIPEGGRIRAQNRRESVETNPPETSSLGLTSREMSTSQGLTIAIRECRPPYPVHTFPS